MKPKDSNFIDGNARVIDEDHINITLRKCDLEKFTENKSGEFIQLHIKKRYALDKYNNTHVVVNGHYKPIVRGDRQPGNADNKGKSLLDI